MWSHTIENEPLTGPQFFCNVDTWVEAFGQEQVDAMLDAFAEVPEFAPVAQSVRSRGVQKLHRVRITDAFGSEASAEALRSVWTVLDGVAAD